MKEVGKWGFLREDSVAAKKAGIDRPTGLHRTGLEDYLRVIFPGADWVHDGELPQGRNLEKRKLRPDYRCEDLNLIVEFDGLPHFKYPSVEDDLLKTQYYQDVLKYNVVRIPYFIQLTKDAVSKFFGKFVVNTDVELFDGRFASLNANNRCLPSCLCSVGLMRMALEFVRFPEQYQVNKDAMEKLNCYTGVEDLDSLYSDFSDEYQNGIANPVVRLRVVINSRLGLNGRNGF